MNRRVAAAADVVAVVAETLALRAALPIALHVLPLDACVDRVAPRRRFGRADGAVERVGRWTDRLLREVRVTRTPCLIRSLTRYRLLRERGVPVVFKMGLRPQGDDVVGHAWIELDGAPLLEREDTRYTVTFSHPPAEP
jgi:hypothetical protein